MMWTRPLPDLPNWTDKEFSFRRTWLTARNKQNPAICLTGAQIEERVRVSNQRGTWLESLQPTALVKPYHDLDKYVDEPPEQQWLAAFLADTVLPPVLAAYSCDEEDVAVAQSHGWVGAGRYKISFRVYVLGRVIAAKELPQLMKDEDFPAEAGWDRSCYPKTSERLMRMVGCVKEGETRVLLPLQARSYSDFVIQHLIGTEQRIGNRPSKRQRAERSPFEKRVGTPEWLDRTTGQLEQACRQAMEAAGMRSGYTFYQQEGCVIKFATLDERWCMHGHTHNSNKCGCHLGRDGSIKYKCFGTACIDLDPVEIGRWRDVRGDMELGQLTAAQRQRFDPEVLQGMEDRMAATAEKRDKHNKPVIESSPDYDAYAKFAVQYISRFFLHVHCAKPEIVQLRYDERDNPVEYTRRLTACTKQIFANTAQSAWPLWFGSASRRVYQGYTFHPDPAKAKLLYPDDVNLATGVFPFANTVVRPLSEEERVRYVLPWQNHVYDVLAAGSPADAQYIWKWLAYIIQGLGNKTKTALYFHGEQGTPASRRTARPPGRTAPAARPPCSRTPAA